MVALRPPFDNCNRLNVRYLAAKVRSNRKELSRLQKKQTVLSVNPTRGRHSRSSKSDVEKKHQSAAAFPTNFRAHYLSRREITNEILGRVELENNHGFAETFMRDFTASSSRKLRSIWLRIASAESIASIRQPLEGIRAQTTISKEKSSLASLVIAYDAS